MDENNTNPMVGGAVNLEHLETQVEALLKTCANLKDENQALRTQQSNLITERASLIEKTEQARSRVEAMIARLKAMEIN